MNNHLQLQFCVVNDPPPGFCFCGCGRHYGWKLAEIMGIEPPKGKGPWLPGPEEITQFRNDIDVALSDDFRELAHYEA